jgi:hypothetical protein
MSALTPSALADATVDIWRSGHANGELALFMTAEPTSDEQRASILRRCQKLVANPKLPLAPLVRPIRAVILVAYNPMDFNEQRRACRFTIVMLSLNVELSRKILLGPNSAIAFALEQEVALDHMWAALDAARIALAAAGFPRIDSTRCHRHTNPIACAELVAKAIAPYHASTPPTS